MLTVEEIKKRLEDRNVLEVQRRTGLGYAQIINVKKGIVEHPRYEVIKALSDYLECEHTKKAEGE